MDGPRGPMDGMGGVWMLHGILRCLKITDLQTREELAARYKKTLRATRRLCAVQEDFKC